MTKILLITHGNFAEGILNSAKVITGDFENVYTYSLNPGDNVADLSDTIQSSLEATPSKENILILTDLLGGSPTNIALSHLATFNFECITGLNLPMLLEALLSRQDESLVFSDYVNKVKDAGTQGIHHVNQLLNSN